MKLLVTGATGFLGKAVVEQSLRRGHAVRAVVRTAKESSCLSGVEVVSADLRWKHQLVEAISGCDAVVHLAAATAGDLYSQLGDTVVGTENLLVAMTKASVKHIVHVSSFSVYDYLRLPSRATVNEETPIDSEMIDRDDYAVAKLLQEQLVRQWAQDHGWTWTVLRPGMIYGKGKLFNSLVGIPLGNAIWIRTGAWARVPLTYLENCADAILLAVEKWEANEHVFNVVDDDPPTQRKYLAMIRQAARPKPTIFPVSWTIMRMVARSVWLANKVIFGGRARVPGLLVPSRLHARCKPLNYDNAKIKRVLGWKPRVSLVQAVEASS